LDHLTLPLEALRARVSWFVLSSDARLLHAPLDPELLEPARDVVAALEWLPDNQAPFLLLGSPGDLAEVYTARRDAYRQSGIELPAIESAPVGVPFAAELAAVARGLTNPELGTRGLMVVLVPAAATGNGALAASEIAALAAARGLERVRWIWLDASDAAAIIASARALAALGPGLVTAPCRIDRPAQKRESSELLAAIIAAVEQRSFAVPGGAGPGVAPPRHPSDPAGEPAPPPPYLLPLLRGIEALRAGGPEQALPWLRRACDAAGAQAREAADMEILLAAVSVQAALAQAPPAPVVPALVLFGSAAARAEAAGLDDVAAKAQLFLGVSARAAGLNQIAARAFTTAAERAASAGDQMLRSQALRLAGEGTP
jgi:hypothetical protein